MNRDSQGEILLFLFLLSTLGNNFFQMGEDEILN